MSKDAELRDVTKRYLDGAIIVYSNENLKDTPYLDSDNNIVGEPKYYNYFDNDTSKNKYRLAGDKLWVNTVKELEPQTEMKIGQYHLFIIALKIFDELSERGIVNGELLISSAYAHHLSEIGDSCVGYDEFGKVRSQIISLITKIKEVGLIKFESGCKNFNKVNVYSINNQLYRREFAVLASNCRHKDFIDMVENHEPIVKSLSSDIINKLENAEVERVSDNDVNAEAEKEFKLPVQTEMDMPITPDTPKKYSIITKDFAKHFDEYPDGEIVNYKRGKLIILNGEAYSVDELLEEGSEKWCNGMKKLVNKFC
jgi:hypothetical protein